jgi:hypothetical protein
LRATADGDRIASMLVVFAVGAAVRCSADAPHADR